MDRFIMTSMKTGRMEKQETETESGNGQGKWKTTITRSVFCANL